MPVGTVTITTVGDMTVTGDRTVTVSGTLPYNPTDYWYYWDERPRIADATLTVVDDDAPPVTLSLSRSEIYEDPNRAASQRRATVTASLENAALATTTITVSAEAGTNAAADDFTLSGTTLTIAAGTTMSTGVVTITAENDQIDSLVKTPSLLDEDGEDTGRVLNGKLVTVSGTLSSGTATAPSGKSLKIFEDDVAALVYTPEPTQSTDRRCRSNPNRAGCTGPYRTVKESGSGNTAMFQVKLATEPTANVTVTVSSADDGEGLVSKAGDAAPAGRTTLTFTPQNWETDQTVTLTGVDDGEVDGDQEYKVNVNPNSVSTDAYSLRPRTRGLQMKTEDTIVPPQDPQPTVTLSLGAATINESGSGNSTTISASLDQASASATTITLAAPSGTTLSGTTLTIAAGSTSSTGTVTITAVDNSIDAPDNAVSVTGSTTNTGVSGPAAVSLTIADDEAAPTVTLLLSSASIPENGGSATVTASLSHASAAQITVAVAAAPGTNAVVGDFRLSASLTLTIAAGSTSSTGTVTVSAVDNSADEANKQVTVSGTTAGGVSGSTSPNPSPVTLTIQDDEGAPTVTLSLSSASISENGGSATVTASLNRASTEATTVTVSASPASPATESDFTQTGTTLTIAAGSTSSTGTVTIAAVDNSIDAPDRTVTVAGTASGGEGATGPASLTLTITDDEQAPTVTLTAAAAEIWESGAGSSTTVSARLSHASSMATTITIQPVPGLYTVGADDTIVIPAGQTTSTDRVTITAVDNAQRSASDPTVMITGDVSNAQGTRAVNAAAVVVRDDEAASVTLSLSSASIPENGGSATVTAVLSRAAPAAVTVTVSAAPGTNAAMRDFRLSENRTLTVAAGATRSAGTVTITATDDAVDAPDRTVTVSGAVSSENRAREPEAVTLTIEDDDETPVATLSLTPAVIDESGANNASTVSATLSNPSSEATTITVSAQGAGYAQRGTTLTIPALGTTSAGAVTLTAVDDEEQTPDREVTVSGRAENAHGVEQPAAVVLTIRDDDGMEMVTEVLLPEAARAMADSRATAVRQRLERAGMEETAELPSLTGLLAQHGPSAQEDSLEWKTLLPQASFALALDADGGGAGGGVTVWGGGDYRNLDGEARGVSWDGEAASAHLGADRLLANGLRVGVAASWSEAKFDYEHKGRSGDWELEMSSAQPYLGWTTAGGIDLWASAGVGSGELEITAGAGGARQSSDADMWLAAAGARGPLYATDSGLEVSLRGEALYSSFEVDGNGSRIRGHTSDVSRLRLALEARRERTLASGARLSPRFELGLRHDGGDGETGAGLELGGGAEYVSGRLRLAGGARALAANSDYDEWGAEAALEYAPGADGRGLTLRLAPSWGAAQSGAAQLWEQGAPGLDGTAAEPDLGGRLAAELGYGLKSPWSRGLLTLALGGELGEDEGVAARLSGRVALDGTSALGLELKLREPKSGGTEHSLMLTGELRF